MTLKINLKGFARFKPAFDGIPMDRSGPQYRQTGILPNPTPPLKSNVQDYCRNVTDRPRSFCGSKKNESPKKKKPLPSTSSVLGNGISKQGTTELYLTSRQRPNYLATPFSVWQAKQPPIASVAALSAY